jgi:soluble lytic murein transglycosylase-like protein
VSKKLVIVGCIGAIMLGSIPPQAVANTDPVIYTQSIKTRDTASLFYPAATFKRLNAKIVTTRPWLNPEKKSFKFSENEIKNILIKAGFTGSGLKKALRIVWLESTNRPYALNKKSNCYGLFQINMTGAMGPDRRAKYGLSKNEDLFDPLINAKIAYDISGGGENWSAWTTSKN